MDQHPPNVHDADPIRTLHNFLENNELRDTRSHCPVI